MNTLLRCSLAAAVLVSTGAAPAQVLDENLPGGGQFFILRARGAPEHLNNPPQRGAVRASLERRYPDLAEAVGIDASRAQKLLDVLTEHQLSTLETGRLSTPQASFDWVLKEADAEAKHLEALRSLLGEDGFERYLDYSTTLRERMQVSTFDTRLPGKHKLLPAQKEQMISLYREDNARRHRESRTSRFFLRDNRLFSGLLVENPQRAAQLATIAANQEHLRMMAQSHHWFWQRAAGFLSAPQRAALSQMHTEDVNSLRQWIESARREAGLDPAIPERSQPPDDEPPELRMPPAIRVSVDIKLTVNRNEPMTVSRVVMNAETVAFEADDGLLVEMTPTIYDNGALDVSLDYYEQRRTGKRRLTDVTTVSELRLEGAPMGTEKFTVATGIKAYAIKADVSVAAL